MASTPTDPTKAQVWITKGIDDLDFEFYFPQGPKGDPGGFTTGTDLLAVDLDTVLTPGLYRQGNSTYTTSANHYPIEGSNGTGVLEVIQQAPGATGGTLQVFYPVWGNRDGRSSYQRTKINGAAFGPWRHFGYTRVDQAAGRAIYQWDDLNAREQLIYADTGLRRLETTHMTNGWTGAIVSLRRIGYEVYMGLYLIDGAVKTAGTALTLPVGFRPSHGGTLRFPSYGTVTPVHWTLITSIGEVQPQYPGEVVGQGGIALFSWTTNDAWPTVLPGTFSTSAPNA